MKQLLTTMRRNEETGTLTTRLVVLLGVDAAATLIACAATGAFHFKLFNGLVALVSATAAVVSLPKVRRRLVSGPTSGAPAAPTPSLDRTKKILILAMLAGAIAYVGGRSTVAIFTAETTNSGGAMSSGTLVLGDKVANGGTCFSYSGITQDNVNGNCTPILAVSNNAPGAATIPVKLTIENDGSLDASTFYFSAPWPRATLGAALTNVAPAQLTLSTGFNTVINTGDQLLLSYAGHTQTYTVAGGPYSAGATAITLQSPAAPNFAYPINTRVEDASGNTSASNADCYDTTTTNADVPVVGATPGNALSNFVSTTGNPLCAGTLLWIQEQTNNLNFCWYGPGSTNYLGASTSPVAAPFAGACRTPTTATTSGSISGVTTSITLSSPLLGNIKNGDALTISDGTHSATTTAAADTYLGASQIQVASFTPAATISSGATVTDTAAFVALNADQTDTISAFDTLHRPNAQINLYPLTGNGTAPTAAAGLGKFGTSGNAGYQRVFYIGVYLPALSGQFQNQLQGLLSTFGFNWHIEQ